MVLYKGMTRRDFLGKTTLCTAGLKFSSGIKRQAASGVTNSENLLGEIIDDAVRSGANNGCHPWSPHNPLQPHCRIIKKTDRPEFEVESSGSIGCHGGWEIVCENIKPGETYQFSVSARLSNIPRPVENVSPEIYFFGEGEKPLNWMFADVKGGKGGDVEFEQFITAPEGTKRVVVRLILRWTGYGSVKFKNIELKQSELKKEPNVKVAVGAGLKSYKTIEANIAMCLDVVREASERGAELVLLPEVIITVGVPGEVWEKARRIPGKETDAFSECARKNRISIAFSMFEVNGEMVHNTGLVFGPRGNILLKYRKLQLAVGEWWDGITPGDSLPLVRLPFGCAGMQICYDNVHPEGIRSLALRGADIILLPIMGDPRCNVKDKGWVREKWDLIMRMRALDNHVWFVVARNNGEGSCVINPAGDIVASMKAGEHLIAADMDLNFRNWSWIGSDFHNRTWHERRPSAFGALSEVEFRG